MSLAPGSSVGEGQVYWPYSCTAYASVQLPVNSGQTNMVDPQVDIQTDFTFSSIVEDICATIVFRAQGSSCLTVLSANV